MTSEHNKTVTQVHTAAVENSASQSKIDTNCVMERDVLSNKVSDAGLQKDGISITNTMLKAAILDITECPICTETLREARALPCLHSFCLSCLCSYGAKSKPGDEMECPMCRKNFEIPVGMFAELPTNHFINKLITINELCNSLQDDKSEEKLCDACMYADIVTQATGICLECNEKLCHSCILRHRGQKLLKNHNITMFDDIPETVTFLKMSANHCEQHCDEKINFFCQDCKLPACVVCYVSKHKEHQCHDIFQTAEDFKTKLENYQMNISRCKTEIETLNKQATESEEDFLTQVKTTEIAINKKYEELLAVVQDHWQKLLKELENTKTKRIKEIRAIKEECERNIIIFESYQRYSSEILEKATAYYTVISAEDLIARADELIQAHDDHKSVLQTPLHNSFKVLFVSESLFRFCGKENVLGKLNCKVTVPSGPQRKVEQLRGSRNAYDLSEEDDNIKVIQSSNRTFKEKRKYRTAQRKGKQGFRKSEFFDEDDFYESFDPMESV